MKRFTLILIVLSLVCLPQAWGETVTPANPVNLKENDSGASVFVKGTGTAAGNTPFAVGLTTGENLFKIDGSGIITVGGQRIRISNNTSPGFDIYQGGTGRAQFGYSTAPDNFITGSVDGDLCIHNNQDATNILFGIYSDKRFVISKGGIAVGSGVSMPGGGVTGFMGVSSGVSPPELSAVANGAGFYAYTGDMYVMSEVGDVTKISPHDANGDWVFDSHNTLTGKAVYINMIDFIKDFETVTGRKYIFRSEAEYKKYKSE
jgi:hypothetical protein